VFELQVFDLSAKQHVEIVIVDQVEASARLAEQGITVRVKSPDLHAGSQHTLNGVIVIAPEPCLGQSNHEIVRGVPGIGDRQYFVRPSVAVPKELRNTLGQNRRLSGTSGGDYKHGTVDVLDGLPLLIGRNERRRLLGTVFVEQKSRLSGGGALRQIVLLQIEEKAKTVLSVRSVANTRSDGMGDVTSIV
jgi:hypothetical protein